MRTMKNILRHELIGLNCIVIKSENSYSKGLSGKIVDETMKTIKIQTKNGTKIVAKKGAIFRLDIGAKIDVDGNALISRPEDRIKKKIRKW